MHRFVRVLSALLFVLLFGSTATTLLRAGGPIGAFGGVPIVWKTPVKLLLDRGVLAQHDSAATYSIIQQCTEAWDTVQGATLEIGLIGYLEYDVRTATDPTLFGAGTLSDGVVPVVIDNDGSITDAFIGAGASASVNGFATPYSTDGRTWVDGRVVINGSRNRNEQSFINTMTHEFGHLIGLSHNQRNHNANYALMNPFGGTLDHEDMLAMLRLYPDDGVLDGRGSISGRVVDAEGNPMSGVNLLAVNTATGEVYSTISDYFSGNDPRFVGPPVSRAGTYRFDALPPGTWFMRMEGVNPEWDGGSSLASYDPPINSGIIDDWYNGGNESGAMHLDNLNEKVGVSVVAGEEITGIDFVENDLTGLTRIAELQGGTDRDWPTPNTFQGVRIGGYAVRHVAPYHGSPVMTRIWIGTWPNIQEADIVVTVYNNRREQGFDLPGTEVGSLRIPSDQLIAGLNYDIWLHEIPGLRFNQGDVFHVGISTEGNGRLNLQFVDRQGSEGTSYYESSEESWRPFPIEGNNDGRRSGELKMETWYSPIRPGDDRTLIAANPDAVTFDPTEVGQRSTEMVTIANIGTTPMEIDNVTITGVSAAEFAFDTIELAGITIAPGERITADVFFLPTAEGAASATLTINGVISLPIPMTGTGTSTAVGQVVSLIDFGQELLNESRSVDTVVIYNRGTVALVAKPGGISGTGFRLLEPKSDGFFQPGDSLNVVVEFTPTEERRYEEELIFTFRPPRDTIRILVTGEGVQQITGAPVLAAGDLGVGLEIVPNPASDQISITVEYPEGGAIRALLVDPLGRVVARPQLEIIQSGYRRVNLSTISFPSGSYRLVVVTAEGSVVAPVSIVR